ncbi:MAG: multicopper oxidase family protein [Nitrosopumilus sp.]|nr:multicopper oxidase family protein [Nitrosopumilus sp.]MBT8251271.1 multicopper oxidase family protein [Nitrosopumilus sp.]NNL52438.1 multicopper oxidase family protein [Nitrosopumilus sp.]NNM02400.1 multicopper oxidase family protein [Nitrosopumilus sp.]
MNSIDKTAILWTIAIVAVGFGFSLYGANTSLTVETQNNSKLVDRELLSIQQIDSPKLVSDMSIVSLSHNDKYDLVASDIIKNIGGQSYEMFGYNQKSPGPLLLVDQGNEITVNFKNNLDFPTTVHWHGLRLDYTSDGVPGITQDPILPGDTFEYELKFPDSGIFLYHPHVRTEMQMELGLYGNILVESKNKIPTTIQVPLILDDVLIVENGLEEFDSKVATHTLMGRFGNTMMINGDANYSLEVNQWDIVRFYLTNTANTRIFDFGIEQHKLKLVADDASNYEKEEFVDSVILASSERRTVDVLFDKPGEYTITHITPEKIYSLGKVLVSPSNNKNDYDFYKIAENKDIVAEIDEFRKYFSDSPDLELEFDVKTSLVHQMTSDDSSMVMQDHENEIQSIEWEDEMPKMNAMSNEENTHWILRDVNSGKEGFDIDYQANVGDVKKIRLYNDPESVHPMQHPIHLHGQRFLVLSENGILNENLAWKDSVLVPTGKTVDILVEFSNPGKWAMHCHILEHAEAGMITEIIVN